MNQIVHITKPIRNGDLLRAVLKSRFDIKTASPDKIDIPDNCQLIIFDWDTNRINDSEIRSSLKSVSKESNIPIIVSLEAGQFTEAITILEWGAAGLIIRPYEAESVSPVLESVLHPHEQNAGTVSQIRSNIIDATADVLKNSCQVSALSKEIYVKRDHYLYGEIGGIMEISGDLTGTVAISLPLQLAAELSGRMAGCDQSELTEQDIEDGVGEIINQISGKTMTEVSKINYTIKIDLPIVVNHKIITPAMTPPVSGPCHLIIFDCLGQTFTVQFCLTANKLQPVSV